MYFRISRCLEKLELKRKIKIYEDILPICRMCKKIRVDSGREHGTGQWISVEKYIHDKAKLNIKSCYCSACAEEFNQFGIDIGMDL